MARLSVILGDYMVQDIFPLGQRTVLCVVDQRQIVQQKQKLSISELRLHRQR